MRVLVVEDDTSLGKSIVTILEHSFGPSVDLACDGPKALSLAAARHYDLVILDWWIPPPTGIELLARWRSNDVVGRVLMLTGSVMGSEREEALAAGADDFLEKPFSLTHLLDRARALVAHSD